MSLGSFSPIALTLLGQEVYLDLMTLSELMSVTQLETSLKVWLQLFSLEMTNQLLCQYLTRTFLTPYWMSEPYSGSGKMICNLRTSRHSPASITLHPHAPKIYYTHFEILRPLSMLVIPFWTDNSGHIVVSNYHFCPDYDLDYFFSLVHVGWVEPNFDDFPDLSDLDNFFSMYRVPFVSIPKTDDVQNILIYMEWFF